MLPIFLQVISRSIAGLLATIVQTESTNKIHEFTRIPVGKMGLSTYVMQIAFGLFIFYGYGFGLLLNYQEKQPLD